MNWAVILFTKLRVLISFDKTQGYTRIQCINRKTILKKKNSNMNFVDDGLNLITITKIQTPLYRPLIRVVKIEN